jgi:hypothetical protein
MRAPSAHLVSTLIATMLILGGCGSSNEGSESSPGGESTNRSNPPASTSTAPQAPSGVRATPCEGSNGVPIRATGISCVAARQTAAAWRRRSDCAPGSGASRGACRLGPFICLSTVTGQGVAVTCARQGASIVFRSGRG